MAASEPRPASDSIASADEGHAVRWAHRKIKRLGNSWDYSVFHWTEDAAFTVCGWSIPLAIEGGTFFPDTRSDPAAVDCKRCRKWLAGRSGKAVNDE